MENSEVLKTLKSQRDDLAKQLEEFDRVRNTFMKVSGAIEVLEAIEQSKEEVSPTETVEPTVVSGEE